MDHKANTRDKGTTRKVKLYNHGKSIRQVLNPISIEVKYPLVVWKGGGKLVLLKQFYYCANPANTLL